MDFFETARDPERHSDEEKDRAQRLFLEALAFARLAYALVPASIEVFAGLCADLPAVVHDLICYNKKDKYTWKASNPAFVQADQRDGRPHIPLNIQVNQTSYAWSYSYAEDFVLFDMSIKNIGNDVLKKLYMGNR